MASTISTLKKKILGRRSDGGGSGGSGPDSLDSTLMDIGTPTNVKRLIHAERDGENGIRGLPPEFAKMLEAMTTAEERQNPENKDKAKNVLIWRKREEEKKDQNFIRSDFLGIGSSGESTASAEGGSSRSSTEEEGKGQQQVPKSSSPGQSTFYVPSNTQQQQQQQQESNANNATATGTEQQQQQLDNRANDDKLNKNEQPQPKEPPKPQLPAQQLRQPQPEGEGEATLRRKKTNPGGGPKGPRVTRNITEEEVYAQINALCSSCDPLEKYERDIELGSGAAGTVFLANNRKTEERVAIKIIDLQKQPKKEMILMELKV